MKKKYIKNTLCVILFVLLELAFFVLLKYYCIEDYRQFDERNSWTVEGVIDQVEEPFWGIYRHNARVKFHINGETYVFTCYVIGVSGGRELKQLVGEKATIIVRENKKLIGSELDIGELRVNGTTIQSLEEQNAVNKEQTISGIIGISVIWLIIHIFLGFYVFLNLFIFRKNRKKSRKRDNSVN